MKKAVLLLLSLTLLSYSKINLLRANALEQKLRGHSFIYTNNKTGLEHTIYFGRFGNNYDEYFPCQFVDGMWLITHDNQLCLEDRVDKTRRNRRECLKPMIKNNVIHFLDTAGKLAYQSKLIRGNSIPLG